MDYSEFFKDFNYLSYMGAFLKWIFIALIICTILLIVVHKLKLFVRKNKIVNIIVKVYFVIIPIYFILFALKIAPIHNTQKELNKLIVSNRTFLTQYTSDFLDEINKDSILCDSSSTKDVVDDLITNFVASRDTSGSKKGFSFAKIFTKIKNEIEIGFLKKIVSKKLIKETSDLAHVDRTSLKKVYTLSFEELFKEGEIVDIFHKQMNRIFRSIYKSILVVFLIGLLIPISEITAAKIIKY